MMYKTLPTFLAKVLLLTFLAAIFPLAAMADETDDFLYRQLEIINQFNKIQENDSSKVISNFVKSQKGNPQQEAFSPESIAAIEAFFRFVFSQDKEAAQAFQALHNAGKLRLEKKSGPARAQQKTGPFSEHVIEAINVNKQRAKYYADRSKGQTQKLSKLYTTLETAILPMAAIFDRWAEKLCQKGIPVMKNDFVSMKDLPTPDTCPARMGRLNQTGLNDYRHAFKDFRKSAYAAAWRKDFVCLQIHAISALHKLKALQQIHHCNLTLSIHLIESIGLAARNADQLKQQHKSHKEIDAFYRAFILSQIFGTRMFANIDLQAQYFHQAGIGIIVNDLPRIPFPEKQ